MMWKVFTFKGVDPEGNNANLGGWFEELLEGLRAEQVVTIGEHEYLIHFPRQYDDTYDEYGNLI